MDLREIRHLFHAPDIATDCLGAAGLEHEFVELKTECVGDLDELLDDLVWVEASAMNAALIGPDVLDCRVIDRQHMVSLQFEYVRHLEYRAVDREPLVDEVEAVLPDHADTADDLRIQFDRIDQHVLVVVQFDIDGLGVRISH